MTATETRENQIVTLLQGEKYISDISEVLPKTSNGLSGKRFVLSTLSAIVKNPKIMNCSIQSIKRAVTEAATIGLVPGTRQAYLVPRSNECTLEVGPDGYKEIALRSKDIRDIVTEVVYNSDEYEFDKINRAISKHNQPLKNRTNKEADVAGFYAIVIYKDGYTVAYERSKAEIDDLRKKSPAPNSAAWVDSYVSMGRTKMLKAVCGELPKTIELAALVEIDADSHLSSKNYVEGDRVESTNEPIDHSNNLMLEAEKALTKSNPKTKEEVKTEEPKQEADIF